MVQGRRGLGLDLEALLELGRVHEVRRQELQGHAPLELEVLGLVNDSHAAVAEFLDDLVLAGDNGAWPHDLNRSFEGSRKRYRVGSRGPQRRRAVGAEPRTIIILGMTPGTLHDPVPYPSCGERYHRIKGWSTGENSAAGASAQVRSGRSNSPSCRG